jgi:NAD(P)-dependent dehydrogenase (short-subunit alcohol dehydrogenase family)
MCASSHGASSGFGKAVAQHVPKNGDVLEDGKFCLPCRLNTPAADCVFSKLTLQKSKMWSRRLPKQRKEVFQRLDVVFNNAGYGALGEIEGIPDDVARSVFEVNFWGNVNVTKQARSFFSERSGRPVSGVD